jgi:hypothetical protein
MALFVQLVSGRDIIETGKALAMIPLLLGVRNIWPAN